MKERPLEPESRFFGPTDRCPRPDRWHSVDGLDTEVEVSELVGALVRARQPDVIVETGTCRGQTSAAMFDALNRNGHGALFTFEIDREYAAVARSRIGVPRVVPAAGVTYEVLECDVKEWTPEGLPPIGLAFLDTERARRLDELEHLYPHLDRDAIVVIHDSAWDLGSLRGWIENAVVKPGLGIAVDLPTPRGVTIIQVNPTRQPL